MPSFTPRPAGRCRDCEFLSDLERRRDRSRLCRIRPRPIRLEFPRWLNRALDAVDRIVRVFAPLDCDPKDRTDDPKDPVNGSVRVCLAKLVAKLSTVVNGDSVQLFHNAIADAVADLGMPEEIEKVFAGFQMYLYQDAA